VNRHPRTIDLFQHGRTDSYRDATISATRDDNKTADGKEKVVTIAPTKHGGDRWPNLHFRLKFTVKKMSRNGRRFKSS
jgi:hypothetical protein